LKNSLLKKFRVVAVAEGISYLVLLLIAMPLKYWGNSPHAVQYVGWAHGLLFVSFMVLLLWVWIKYKWGFGKVILAFIASLLPFGTFVLDRKLKREEVES
jgi:integral membrane protein